MHQVRYFFLISILFISLYSCQSSRQENGLVEGSELQGPQVKRDLPEIKEDGKLKAITTYGMTSYFLYKGMPMGFEYELLKTLATHLNLELEIVIAEDIDKVFDMLNSGKGDIIAHGLTITESRNKLVDFTEHHYATHQVLVQRKPENWRNMKVHNIKQTLVNDVIELIGDTVSVRKNSSYYYRLINLSKELGGNIYIDKLSGNLTTDEIIQMVVDGKIKYTVADYNIAAINRSYHPGLDIETQLSLSQRIAWATRKNSPKLKTAVNEWVDSMKNEVNYYVIYNKYFKAKKNFNRRIRSEFYSAKTGKISPYDQIIKKYSQQIGWDWRLVASLIYQESQFKPNNQSWAGARGLMQMMPATAEELGVTNILDPEDNIRGGTKYLDQMWRQWSDIPDSVQRVKFVLASYNCGYYHVRDAQRLAEKHNADPLVWDGSVAEYLLKLSSKEYYTDPVVKYGYVRGQEPYKYVSEIFERFQHYNKFVAADTLNTKDQDPL
ncbi:MAG: transporter substrate-binding domain-containing protein [Chitinophagales bacterium]